MRYVTSKPPPAPRTVFVLGLDLGKVSDFSSLVVVERRLVGESRRATRRIISTAGRSGVAKAPASTDGLTHTAEDRI